MPRTLKGVLEGAAVLEGAGVLVHRPFPSGRHSAHDFDPFLLLDEMGPLEMAPGSTQGFPPHPHRGFETVTYLLSGRFEHRDSSGHHGHINAGDVQWMTAGSGLVHSETPEAGFRRQGGKLHGFQIWVNLPQRDKMIAPRYQEVPRAQIPEARSADGRVGVKVIAGEALGAQAVIDTRIPIQYLHFTIEPGASFTQPVPQASNAFAYVFGGTALIGGRVVGAHHLAVFHRDGDTVEIAASPESQGPVEVILLSGEPLNEPVARYGPFVMNTKEEIIQAAEDYQADRMGTL
jgi:redox-sensitive bicupin YhaK (pirin superfamily)